MSSISPSAIWRRCGRCGETAGVLTVNLGTGRGYSVLDMVRAFEQASGRPVPYRIAPRRPGDIAQCYADPSLARKLLGWQAERGIEAMCADTWRWQQWAAAENSEPVTRTIWPNKSLNNHKVIIPYYFRWIDFPPRGGQDSGFRRRHFAPERNPATLASPQGSSRTHSAGLYRFSGLPLSIVVAWVAAIAFICFLSAIFYYSRLSVERHMREQTVAVAQMVADRIALAFDNTDHLLSSIVDDLQPGDCDAPSPTPSGRQSNAQALLARAQAQHRDIHSLTLVNANGHLLAQASGEGGQAPPDNKNLPVVGQDDPRPP